MRACSNNVDGDCVTSLCRRLGSTDCDSLEEVARVAIQCGRANPCPVPYPVPYVSVKNATEFKTPGRRVIRA